MTGCSINAESDVTAPGLVPTAPSRATRAELQTQHFIVFSGTGVSPVFWHPSPPFSYDAVLEPRINTNEHEFEASCLRRPFPNRQGNSGEYRGGPARNPCPRMILNGRTSGLSFASSRVNLWLNYRFRFYENESNPAPMAKSRCKSWVLRCRLVQFPFFSRARPARSATRRLVSSLVPPELCRDRTARQVTPVQVRFRRIEPILIIRAHSCPFVVYLPFPSLIARGEP